MIEFENPFSFFLLALIPVLFFLRYLKLFTKISFPLILSDWNGENFKWDSKARKFFSFIATLSVFSAYVLTVIALANPVLRKQEKIFTSRGSDIIFVIDVSPSMAARDIGDGSRLDAARDAIYTVASSNEGDSLGLVELAGEAAYIVPPTMDRKVFYDKLQSIVVGELGDGTAIGTGLSCAVYHLEHSTSSHKSIILITDGENNAGQIHPFTAAHMALANNIKLYVLGVGTKGEVPLEYTDPKTGKVYAGKFYSNYESSALAEIASEAKGKFYEVETLQSLTQALVSVSKKENTAQTYSIKNNDTPYYQKFLFAAILLIALAWIIRRIFLQEII